MVYGDQRPQGGMMLEFLNLAEDLSRIGQFMLKKWNFCKLCNTEQPESQTKYR